MNGLRLGARACIIIIISILISRVGLDAMVPMHLALDPSSLLLHYDFFVPPLLLRL
jgi:cytochrome c oxidase subunit IV